MGLPPPALLPAPRLGPLLCCYLGFFHQEGHVRSDQTPCAGDSKETCMLFPPESQTQVDTGKSSCHLSLAAGRPSSRPPITGVQPLKTPASCDELSCILPSVLLAQGLISRLLGFTSLSRHPSPYPPRLPLLLTAKLSALTFSRDNYYTT